MSSDDVKQYSPYLHKLDMDLDIYLLRDIGVETSITLIHNTVGATRNKEAVW